jgi:hypothetical protein
VGGIRSNSFDRSSIRSSRVVVVVVVVVVGGVVVVVVVVVGVVVVVLWHEVCIWVVCLHSILSHQQHWFLIRNVTSYILACKFNGSNLLLGVRLLSRLKANEDLAQQQLVLTVSHNVFDSILVLINPLQINFKRAVLNDQGCIPICLFATVFRQSDLISMTSAAFWKCWHRKIKKKTFNVQN